jgi:Ca2+-binding RTX toxin-like protein
MARIQAGIVDSLHGAVRVIHADGSTEILQTGDPVYSDDRIITGAGAGVRIDLPDGSTLTLGPDFSARLDTALLAEPDSLPQTPGIEAPETLQDILAEGGDPTGFAEPPAAGETTPADAGHSHVRLEPSNLALTPESGFETTPVGYGFTEPREELLQSPQQDDGGGPDAESLDLHVANEPVNLVVVLDKSSSMLADPGVDGYDTRFDLAVDAIHDLFEAYDSNSDVNVLVVDFSSARFTFSSGWLTLGEATAYLDAVQVRGFTDYREALLQVREAFNPVDDPAPGASQSMVYFLTDGNPLAPPSQGGGRLTAEDVAAWEAFLSDPANNITRAYAIGIGDGIDPQDDRYQLEEVAFPNDEDGNPVILDEADLASGLVERVEAYTVSGNLVTETGTEESFARGEVQLLSLAVDGTTYSYDPDADEITGGSTGPVSGSVLAVATDLGANLEFDFLSGGYRYTVPEVGADSRETFVYTLADNDGLTAAADFTVHVAGINPDSPVADIAGGSGIDVIYGTSGDDILNGGDGDDILFGRLGNDELTGGGGADTFVYRAVAEGPDTITDYDLDEQDVLDISGILVDADPNDVVANIDNYISATSDGSDTRIAADPTGSGTFDDADIATLAAVSTGQVILTIADGTQTAVDIV